LEGFHTNNIENLWSIIKYEIKRRKGIPKSSIQCFVEEFAFRYSVSKKWENVGFLIKFWLFYLYF
jgi:hypothetical protein